MWATMLLQSRSRELWVRQIIMCTVPSPDRRRRFLQYNVMDPGLGVTISYGGPGPPAPLPAGAGADCSVSKTKFPQCQDPSLRSLFYPKLLDIT